MSDAASAQAPKQTPLYDRHVALGARVIDFGGWAMPVQYKRGILEEHRAVREAVGLFDVCHMGEVRCSGPRAAEAVQRVVTNDVSRLGDGDAMYTCTCREDGGIVDDLIVYRVSTDDYFLIVNASTTDKDYAHFVEHAGEIAQWENLSAHYGLLSVQGPRALALVAELASGPLPERAFRFGYTEIAGQRVMVSRTGYTGEDGVELALPAAQVGALWDLLLDRGKQYGIEPVGLGARDTLRLEARLSLYGNDIDEQHNPIEAGLGWVVKGKGYVGEAALERARAEGPTRKLVGFKVEGRGIARHGYAIHRLDGGVLGEAVGVVTSGTVAPTVGGAIGLGWVPTELSKPGTRLGVDCRGKPAVIELVAGPFYKRK